MAVETNREGPELFQLCFSVSSPGKENERDAEKRVNFAEVFCQKKKKHKNKTKQQKEHYWILSQLPLSGMPI